MTDKLDYCRQCAKAAGATAYADDPTNNFVPHPHALLMIDCAGCGMTILEQDGSCHGGLRCSVDVHDKTPWAKKQVMRFWWPLRRTVKNLWYRLQCTVLPWRRYHMLDCRYGDWTYGWADVDYRMLGACFNLLKGFVEKEEPFERTDYTTTDEDRFHASEIKALYQWWTVDRQREHDAYDAEVTRLYSRGARPTYAEKRANWAEEERLLQTDDDNLIRLMKLRRRLWT